jgi:excisionase family DNA binding protein
LSDAPQLKHTNSKPTEFGTFPQKMRIPNKTIYDWIYRKKMPAECVMRINGRVRLNSKAVEAWLHGQNT